MRLKAEQLAAHCQQSLLPAYLIHGDEALLVEECSDLVRQAARRHGVEERQVWHIEGRFDWSTIPFQSHSLSLFSSQRLLEIRLPSGSPGKEGSEALRRYAQQGAPETTVLIISGKIDARSQKSQWFTALDKIGAIIPVWPVDLAHLPQWISQRMQQKGLRADREVAALIAERVEGNLFAAAQEVDKLQLLCPDGQVDTQLVRETIADNARYQAFSLMDAAYAGHIPKVIRIVHQLRAEGNNILSVFSAVAWSIQRMADMAFQLKQGAQPEQVFARQRPPVYDKSRTLIYQALMRHHYRQWQQFLIMLADIDQAAKGMLEQCPWLLLESLCLKVAGA